MEDGRTAGLQSLRQRHHCLLVLLNLKICLALNNSGSHAAAVIQGKQVVILRELWQPPLQAS